MSDENASAPTGTAESADDFGQGDAAIVKRYLSEIKIFDRAMDAWNRQVRVIIDRYRNEKQTPDTPSRRKYALLWSTVQVQTPALFYRVPVPIVERRWKDAEDIIAQTGAEVLQRALTYQLDIGDFAEAARSSVFDYIIAGRGQVWLRKEVDKGEAMDSPANGDDSQAPGEQIILDERICVDAVPWPDFGHTLARNWKEVSIVWRRLYMTRQQLVDRFGSVGNMVELDYTPTTIDEKNAKVPPHLYKLATVYEIWDRTTQKATWIALGYQDKPLDQKDDPLRIRGFFPCPRPIYSSEDTTSLVPLPDYIMWEDQAKEVDDLTARLYRLIRACKVAGGYDPSVAELASLFEDSIETDLIPFKNWAEFAQKGGFKGCMELVDLKNIIEAMGALFQAREAAKNDAQEISGVGDIIRGQNGGPEKSATEARITGQFGTLRLQDRQREIQRFCRDIIRMMGELIAEGFTPETLEAMTGVTLPTPLEKQAAQRLIDQDKAYQAYQKQQAANQPPQQPMAA